MSGKSILLLAGEASGDYHAAQLTRDLKSMRPDISVVGIGGEKLIEAGMELISHYKEINAVGPKEGLTKLGKIFNAYNSIKARLNSGKYSLFIPVDYPDVNLRLCGVAKKAKVPVCYYISPQVWAWRRGRLKQIRATVDRMMTIFPFEAEFYRNNNVEAQFVGHTMVREIPEQVNRDSVMSELGLDPSRRWVTIAPGSRPTEIKRILPGMCKAAVIFKNAYQDASFVLPLAGEHLRPLIQDLTDPYQVDLKIISAPASKIMGVCESGLITSGTATLQAALSGLPHALVYSLDPVSWFIAIRIVKPLMMDKDLHVGIANALSIYTKEVHENPIDIMEKYRAGVKCLECHRPLLVPELLQHWATPETMADWLARFRTDPYLKNGMKEGFTALRRMLEPPGEVGTAAHYVIETLEKMEKHR